jgi:hypothetical protein
LEADHRGINKFESNADPNYIKVLEKLKRLVNSAPNILRRGTATSLASRPVTWADGYIHQAAPNKTFKIIPYSQNEKFTGREGVSAELTRYLSMSGHRRAALYGLEGVGYVPVLGRNADFRADRCRKTQVALDYVHRQVDSECHIFWVNGGSWATFSQDYRDISTRVGLLVIDDKEDETLLRLKNWLESEDSGDWVLVVDNADNPSEFRDSRYIPQRFKGKLIVTTRSCRVANQLGCEPVEVPKMDANEAEVLFKRLYTAATDTGLIRNLLEALEYLPLAIVGAAAYMGETGTLPTEYLEMHRTT